MLSKNFYYLSIISRNICVPLVLNIIRNMRKTQQETGNPVEASEAASATALLKPKENYTLSLRIHKHICRAETMQGWCQLKNYKSITELL